MLDSPGHISVHAFTNSPNSLGRSRPIEREGNQFRKCKGHISCSQVSRVMEQVQCSAWFPTWKWGELHSPASLSSLSLNLPICNIRGKRLLLISVMSWESEKVAALFLFCSCEEFYEWFIDKALSSLYPSLNLFLDICAFGYGFYCELTSSIMHFKPREKWCRLIVPLNSLLQGETPFSFTF